MNLSSSNYLNKKIFIYGLGKTGLSTLNFLKKKGNEIICWDDQSNVRKKINKQYLLKSKRKISKYFFDYIVLSPGIDKKTCDLKKFLYKNERKIITDLDIFYSFNHSNKIISITPKNIEKYAGIKKFRKNELEDKDLVGITTGLAWTEVGGELLLIEAVSVNGKGRIISTGKLGDVMKESVRAAESYVKSRSDDFGVNSNFFNTKDIHVHVPEGATPKDGPSAGIAMVTSIVSSITGIPVNKNVAMTGEVTLRGQVLPIGGLKEKLLAAHRGRIPKVLIPEDNKKDLVEIPKNILDDLEITTVKTVDEVLKVALVKELKPVEWIDVENLTKSKSGQKPAPGSTH